MSYDLSTKQEHILQATTFISGSVSIVACLFVIWTYLKFREIRVFHLRIILCLTVTDLFWFVSHFHSPYQLILIPLFQKSSMVLVLGVTTRNWSVSGGEGTEQYYVCLVVGTLVQFFLLAGILWTFCIAHTLFMVLTIRDYNPERFEIGYHIICWTIPTICDIILIVTGSIGDYGIW